MFNTMQVARTIREARIARNMTQMNLADAMEVSYQAVSNWERGNSMPDISKLEQLCQVLGIRLNDLLGGNSSQAVTKVMEATSPAHAQTAEAASPAAEKAAEAISPDITWAAGNTSSAISQTVYRDSIGEPAHGTASGEGDASNTGAITVEDICNVAPLLPPSDIETLMENNMQRTAEKIDFSAITALAPFLDSEYLERLIQDAHVDSLREICSIAPFLSTSALDSLVLNSDPDCDMNGIISVAPFLSSETLNTLALDKIHSGSLTQLAGLAPFLSSETLDALVERTDPDCDMPGLTALLPFLSADTLNRLAVRLMSGDMSSPKMTCLFPFLSQGTLQQIAEIMMKKKDLAALKNIAPFI